MMIVRNILRKISKTFLPFKGGGRLSDIFRQWYIKDTKTYLVSDFDGDLKLYCQYSSHIDSYILWRGYYSYSELLYLKTTLKKDSTFVDIGAHKGEFSLFTAKYTPLGKIYAFEPNTQNFQRLNENVELNGFPNIYLYPIGLSDEMNKASLYGQLSTYADGTINDGLPTLYAHHEKSTILEEIQLDTLDNIVAKEGIRHIDIIKIDVEGNEWKVLKGGIKTIQAMQPILIVEFNSETFQAAGYTPEALFEYLQALGYSFFELGYMTARLSPLSSFSIVGTANIVCLPR